MSNKVNQRSLSFLGPSSTRERALSPRCPVRPVRTLVAVAGCGISILTYTFAGWMVGIGSGAEASVEVTRTGSGLLA